MAAVFLRDHPELRPFVLPNVRLTGRRIGAGSYGSVEEVEIPGATCAAKKIHDIFQDRSEIPEVEIRRASRQFVVECQLMSGLRHPHVVQFLGVCFLPGSRLPALVMERLLTSLHEILDPETEPETPDTKPYIPLGLKCSILYNVAQGLSFLHSHAPPIIHRDLSARNVLLDSAMVAKIADLGMARIVPSLRAATMTKAPGASIYMPPEALEDESRYDMTIDIFSFGVLAVFILSQTFPKPLSAAYMDARRMMIGRTELERRANYMQQIHSQLRDGHPLIVMIQRCLKNLPQDRPAVGQVVELLDEAKTEVQDVESDMNKLELVQTLREKTQLIRSNGEEVRSLTQQVTGRDAHIQQLQSNLDTKAKQIQLEQEVIQSQQKEIQSQREEILQLKQQLQLQMEKPVQKSQSSDKPAAHGTAAEKPFQNQKSPSSADSAVHGTAVEKPVLRSQSSADSAVPGTPVQPLKWPLPLKWRRGKDIPFRTYYYHVVILNGMVYVGGGEPTSKHDVLQYNPGSGEWSKLPTSPVRGFAMASLNGQLVLVGNHCGGDEDRITVWDSTSGGWGHPYPAMPTGRSGSAAVGYQNYLIVACGFSEMDTVEVLDSSSGRWYSAQPVPMGGIEMSSAVVGDHWYLSADRWKDSQTHIFSAHLPTLISSATSAAQTNTTSIWQELPTPPVHSPTLLALQSHLLLVRGSRYKQLHRYDPQAKEWRECGQLPVGMAASSCAVLPSGELIVMGGLAEGGYSKQVWIGKYDK